MNEAFNVSSEEVLIDFTFLTIYPHQTNIEGTDQITRLTLIVMRDTGTGYTEARVAAKRSVDTIISAFERVWICHHGAPKRVSADDEYDRNRLTNFLTVNGIQYRPRPTRRHNKTGLVERKNGVLKDILRRLILENTSASITDVVTRANFFTNVLRGFCILSSFELARGYQPSMAGIPETKVTKELINAHTE